MSTLIIEGLEESVESRLRVRAAQRGHSMEEEARQILRAALEDPSGESLDLGKAIRRHLEPVGGVNLRIAPREPMGLPRGLGK